MFIKKYKQATTASELAKQNSMNIDILDNELSKIPNDTNGSTIDISQNKSITGLETSKQDKLTAGKNITIIDNVISAVVDIPDINGDSITATIKGQPNTNMAGAITQNVLNIATNTTNIATNTTNIALKENITDHKTDIDNLQTLINQIKQELTPWVIGETKLVYPNTTMPSGWAKVKNIMLGGTTNLNNLVETFSLNTNGTNQNTAGLIGYSKFRSGDNNMNYKVVDCTADTGNVREVIQFTATQDLHGRQAKFTSDNTYIDLSKLTGGLALELWKYVGVGNEQAFYDKQAHDLKVKQELEQKKQQEMNTKQGE